MVRGERQFDALLADGILVGGYPLSITPYINTVTTVTLGDYTGVPADYFVLLYSVERAAKPDTFIMKVYQPFLAGDLELLSRISVNLYGLVGQWDGVNNLDIVVRQRNPGDDWVVLPVAQIFPYNHTLFGTPVVVKEASFQNIAWSGPA